jgi:hypothetical protein
MRSNAKQRRLWLIAAFLGIVALLVFLPLARSQGRTQWAVAFDSADAGFYQITWEEPATNRFAPRFVSRARVFYVLKVFSRTEIPSPFRSVLGTDRAAVGMALYDPEAKQELGHIVAIDAEHRFEDGSSGEALLLMTTDRTKTWVRRANMTNVWVGR